VFPFWFGSTYEEKNHGCASLCSEYVGKYDLT